jgi:hypothetical protein
MKKNEKRVAWYFFVILILTGWFSTKEANQFVQSEKIDHYTLMFKTKNNSQFQRINFNAFIPDTSLCKSNVRNRLSIDEKKISGIPTSLKWLPPLANSPTAICYAWRYDDSDNRNSWNYHTTILNKHSLNILSVFIDPANFFDFTKGIYTTGICHLFQDQPEFTIPWWLIEANWTQRGKVWERPLHFQYLDSNGKLLFESDAGARINGNATRGFPQKSLRLNASKKYGNKSFKFNFFGTSNSKKYFSLILRNSGNDWGRTMCADGFIQSCLKNANIDKQSYEPVVMYLNGVYWGLYALNERMDEDFFANKYNTKKKNITLLEGSTLSYGKESERTDFLKAISFCKSHSMKESRNFNLLCEKFDLENLLIYSAIEIYCANRDWPKQNVQVAKIKDRHDNKWFFALRDLDCSYSYSGKDAYAFDMFEYLNTSTEHFAVIFNACMKNNEFRVRLKKVLVSLMHGPFSISKQLKQYEVLTNSLTGEISYQVNRWRKPLNKKAWLNHVSEFKQFISTREAVLFSQMDKHLN